MAKTQSERIEGLVESTHELSRQADLTDAAVTRLGERVVQSEQRLLESERRVEQLRIEVAVLRRDVDELRKAGDVWGTRLWSVAMLVLGSAVGGVVTYLVKR